MMPSRLDDLTKGQMIRVIKSFNDFDGNKIEVNSVWTFREYSYFPYDGGYTYHFEEGIIRMAEISNGEDYYVMTHANEFFDLL
jgi:hypothetical protein